MAADSPLTRLALAVGSVADDLGFIALKDLSEVLVDIAAEYRVIGGHMVTVLAARWRLGSRLYRETGDVDLGIPPVVARDERVAGRLKDIDYEQVAGNRFARGMPDIPAGLPAESDLRSRQALIDVLIPAYTSRARQNVRVGEDLFTTEVPGLQLALARPAVVIGLELRRLNGQVLRCQVPFADELSALVLKGLATTVRSRDTDASDVWRCLEIAFAAGLGPDHFAGGMCAEAAAVIKTVFASQRGAAMTALTAEQHLSAEAATQRFTRLRALIARVLGPA